MYAGPTSTANVTGDKPLVYIKAFNYKEMNVDRSQSIPLTDEEKSLSYQQDTGTK
jgi:hypothetical protein